MKDYFQGLNIYDEEESGDRRRTILPLIAWAIVIGLALAAALYPAFARAETAIPVHVIEEGQLSVRMLPGPCVDAQSAMHVMAAAPQYATRFKAIESSWPHRDGTVHEYGGCWLDLSAEESGVEGGALALIFSDGARYIVPKSAIKPKGRGA